MVSSEVPLLNTESAYLGTIVDAKRVADLPLSYGNPFLLIGLTVVGLGQGGAPKVLARVPVAPGVHTGALDSEGGRLFLPAGKLKLVHGQRPAVEPGTSLTRRSVAAPDW